MNADRRIVGIGIGLSVIVGMTMFRGHGIYYGLPILVPGMMFGIILWVGRAMYKADPYMLDVWVRSMNYKNFYPAKSHIGTVHPEVKRYSK